MYVSNNNYIIYINYDIIYNFLLPQRNQAQPILAMYFLTDMYNKFSIFTKKKDL